MNWPTSNPLLDALFLICMVGFVSCLWRGSWLQWAADEFPRDAKGSLRWRWDNRRYLNPSLYDDQGKQLLRRGWRWIGAAMLWLVGLVVTIVLAGVYAAS